MTLFVHDVRKGRQTSRPWLVGLLSLSAALACGAAQTSERVELRIGDHLLRVEVATTLAQRTQGLMGRPPLQPDEGMVFVFPGDDTRCLWMRDTPSALAAAFITAEGTILNVTEMQPQTDTHHCSRAPARYALETAAGWFSQHGITAGMKVQGLGRIAPALK